VLSAGTYRALSLTRSHAHAKSSDPPPHTHTLPRAPHAQAIAFPYYRDGVLVNVKYRTLDKKFWQVKGAEKVLYGLGEWTRAHCSMQWSTSKKSIFNAVLRILKKRQKNREQHAEQHAERSMCMSSDHSSCMPHSTRFQLGIVVGSCSRTLPPCTPCTHARIPDSAFLPIAAPPNPHPQTTSWA
jgi:hypothetical protein